MVNIFNGYYFLFIIIFIVISFILYFFLKDKNKEQRKNILLILSILALFLHFLKLAFEPYKSELPGSIRKVTFENICAVSTLIFPFILLSHNDELKDYLVILGTISGFLAIIIPTEVLGKSISFETIRFYIAHYSIFAVGFFMGFFRIHHLNIKRIFKFPLTFIKILCLILINEVILIAIGYVDCTLEEFLSSSYRNSSFIFGILPQFESISFLLNWLVPSVFKKDVNGNQMYWPIVWLIIPVYFYFSLIYFIFCFIYEREETKNYILKFRGRIC